MKGLVKTITAIALVALPLVASAQKLSKIPQRNEIITVEIGGEGSDECLEVFDSPKDGVNRYYLSVGHLGIGNDVLQVMIDPAFELFIPLGGTVTEALDKLKELQALYKTSPGTSIEVQGCLAFGFPNDEKLETVKVTYRKVLLSRMLEFSVKRGDYIRATHIGKSDFGSVVSGVKLHHKMFPKQ